MTQQCTIDKIIRVLSELQSQLNDIPPSKKAIVNNDEQPVATPILEKRPSWCGRVVERFKKIGKVKSDASSHASDSGSQGRSRRIRGNIGGDQKEADLEIMKLQSDIRQMKAAFENLTKFQNQMSKSLEHGLPSNQLKGILEKTDSIRSRSHDLKEIRRKIFNLKCQIPSLLYKQSTEALSSTDSQTGEESGQIVETGSDIYLPGLHLSDDFKLSATFEEVVDKFIGLEFTQKLCLLSFAVFPENKEVKRTMLMYWWLGEGFISCEDSENSVRRILNEFSTKRLLEPVEDERKLYPNSYKMEPHVHSAVIYLARLTDLFDLYSSKGKRAMKKSKKKKLCLVRGSSLLREAKTSVMEPKALNSVFNSSERYPDFTFKWFPQMDSLRVLYLGRWERTAKRHIEVESTEFLKNMKTLKNLRLASFQGISRIEKLEKSICALPKLVILDLRACYSLEDLPVDIGSLGNLIYLDVSECYMLDRMPKGIEDLQRLQVLKGFVISESDEEQNCAVKRLVNLRRLSITVNKFHFKVEKLMESLKGLERLESLKIAWGARFEDKDTDQAKGNKETTSQQKEKDKERGHATEEKHKDLKEREDDQVHKKGQTSEEKKGDVEEKGKPEVGPEDGVSSKKEDGRHKKANLEEGKKRDEVKAESSNSDKVDEIEKTTSPSQESIETIQKKPDDQKEKRKVEEEEEADGDKRKADQEEAKKRDEVKTESLKPEKKDSPSGEKTGAIQNKPGDQEGKSKMEGDGDKGKADLEEGKKQDEVDAEKSKSTEMKQKKPDDKSKVEKEENGDKGKDDLEEGKKKDEVDTKKSKSENGVEEVKKASPSGESTNTIENKPNEHQKGDREEEKGDGEKEKADLVEGKKKDEVKAESSKPDKVIEGDEKTSPPQESKDTNQSKPNDHQRGDKQEDKGDGEKEKDSLEEGEKKDKVKAERSKPDKVIEGDEKTSPSKESKGTIQSKPGDHKENSKVQEIGDGEKNKSALKKLDGGEAKTQKLDKKTKLGKKVSFSEEPKAPIQKKPDDRRKDNAIVKENHEKTSPSRPKITAPEESGSSKPKQSTVKRSETKIWGKRRQEEPTTDTLPSSLRKLELECFPEKDPPKWLNPIKLNKLEKLSIKGGNLSRISDELATGETYRHIQTLRLKYLHEFKAEWKDLQALFPQMKLLEKYKCPKVAFCPTDGNGVWRSQP